MARMTLDRIRVKQLIINTRKVVVRGQYMLLCDLCGRPNPTDLHEVLIERDDANGNAAVLKLVTEAPENLQLLCNTCNIGAAKENKHRDYLIGRQIVRFGRKMLIHMDTWGAIGKTPKQIDITVVNVGEEVLSKWIEGLGMKDPNPYLRRIWRVADELIQSTPRVEEPHAS